MHFHFDSLHLAAGFQRISDSSHLVESKGILSCVVFGPIIGAVANTGSRTKQTPDKDWQCCESVAGGFINREFESGTLS